MQSLLSPAEKHAFQSFLSSIDFHPSSSGADLDLPLPDAAASQGVTLSASEWALYNGVPSSSNSISGSGAQTDGTAADGDDPLMEGAGDAEHREALKKATQDLMALDGQTQGRGGGDPGGTGGAGWDARGGGVGEGMAMNVDHPMGMAHTSPTQAQMFAPNGHINLNLNTSGSYDPHHDQRMLVHQQQVLQHQAQHHASSAQTHSHSQVGQGGQRQPAFASTHEHFPFLSAKAQRVLPELTYPAHPMAQGAGTQVSGHHLGMSPVSVGLGEGSSSTSPHSHSFNFPQQQQHSNGLPLHHHLQQVHIPPQSQAPSTSRSTPAIPTASSSSASSSSRPQIKVSTSTPANLASSSSSLPSPRRVNGTSSGGKTLISGVNGASTSSSSSSSHRTSASTSASSSNTERK
ncbi:hypothetical protein CVT26_012963, partial [Gymnopilus dilepis]